MEQNHIVVMQLADQPTLNIPEISEATVEQSPMASRYHLLPPFRVHENPNEHMIEDTLERSLKRRLGELPDEDEVPESFLISRIPATRRERNKVHLDPRLVSIGPYHCGRENLRAMGKQKVRFLRDFLARSPSISVEYLIKKMKSLESKARQFYSENIELESDQFVEMLLLDACFIAEFISKLNEGGLSSVKLGLASNTIDLYMDILLIENQLPFFVLASFLDVSDAAKFVGCYDFLFVHQTRAKPPSCQIAHLLHLCYQLNIPLGMAPYKSNSKSSTVTIKFKQLFRSVTHRFLPLSAQENEQNSTKEPVLVIPSASELCEAGITFKKKQSPLNLLDITFDEGIIEMPAIRLDASQKRILQNLLAFEQSKYKEDQLFFSSYLYLMVYIVRTSNDVAILRQCGIISTFEPNEEENALFFNHVVDLFSMAPQINLLNELFRDIKDYYEGSWHQYRAKLKRDYFNSPWSIISLGAGFVLLVLTFLQTVYGIKSNKT